MAYTCFHQQLYLNKGDTMTTKWKIIAGFLVMIMLVGTVAAIGFRSLSGASGNFEEYRRLARLNVLYSDILAQQFAAASALRLFTTNLDPAQMETARAAVRRSLGYTEEALTYSRRQVVIDTLNSVRQRGGTQIDLINAIERATLELMEEYNRDILPAGRTMGAELVKMIQMATDLDNPRAIQAAAEAMDRMAFVRVVLSRLVFTRTTDAATRSVELMATLTTAVNNLGATLYTAQGRALFAEVQKAHDTMLSATNSIVAKSLEVERKTREFRELGQQLRADVEETSNQVNQNMRAQGSLTLESNAAAQTGMSITALVGLLFGALVAAFIIWGLVRVLRDVSCFAGSVANGDFNVKVASREKGEIGAMIQAIQQIPATLQGILEDYRNLGYKIEHGELAAKIDTTRYKGGFAQLAEDTNAAIGLLVDVVDDLPSPLVMLDANLNAAYVNRIGREVVGADCLGKSCKALVAREDYGSPADALQKAVATLKPASAETRARPQGKIMDISYTSVPVLTKEGKLASIIQLVTDLTSIKETQRTIMRVAEQASAIADRVAAASEELSAQVEEVSQGAEMQRNRVESTATAMTEMNSTVLEVARSAGQASEQAEATRNKAGDGAILVNKVVQSINLVNTVAATLQTNMQELGTQAESIGGVMNVISDIADQTNLLALNAAIEAARAGEAGRGFAVVADEVRKLAEKTMSATREVGENITAIQQSAHTNIKEVGEAAKAVTAATDLANTSGQALEEIVSLASTNSSVVASIATAAEEQSATSEEINQAIEEISRIVVETSNGMTQASQAVSDLAQTAQELNRVMGELKKSS